MPFKKGQSGNAKGLSNLQRRLYRRFYADMKRIWDKEGISALERVARDDPAKFIQVAAGMLPKQMVLDVDVKETKVIELGSVLSELAELTKKLGLDSMKELPHNRVIEHKEIEDEV